MPLRCCLLWLFVLAVAGPASGWAQANRLIPVGDWTYDVITRLQRRGHLLALNPTALPYRHGDVWAALSTLDADALNAVERRWLNLLERELQPPERSDDHLVVGGELEGGVRAINSERMDVVRPLGDTLDAFPQGHLFVYLDAGPAVAQLGWRADRYYERDPDGLDTARRLLIRSEEAYVGVHHRLAAAYLGRWSNHWSPPGEAAALISSNPRSQDQFVFRLGGQRLSVTGLLAELDSITDDGRFTGRVADDSVRVGNRRRYVAAHRWDWRPSRHFMISAMESAIYSGKNASISLKYLNPLHTFTFVIDNTPKNDENNGFIAGLLWAQYQRFTLHGQWMVDDFDARREGNEPISFTLVSSLVYAGSTYDLGATLTMVSARTYNAPQSEGRYLYLLRGLATQFSDYVHASVFADLYMDALLPGLSVTPRVHLLGQGEQDIRRPFPQRDEHADLILDGTPAWTFRPAVQLAYQRVPWFWLRVDAGVNVNRNVGHVEERSETRFVGLVEAGLRISLDRAFPLTF